MVRNGREPGSAYAGTVTVLIYGTGGLLARSTKLYSTAGTVFATCDGVVARRRAQTRFGDSTQTRYRLDGRRRDRSTRLWNNLERQRRVSLPRFRQLVTRHWHCRESTGSPPATFTADFSRTICMWPAPASTIDFGDFGKGPVRKRSGGHQILITSVRRRLKAPGNVPGFFYALESFLRNARFSSIERSCMRAAPASKLCAGRLAIVSLCSLTCSCARASCSSSDDTAPS